MLQGRSGCVSPCAQSSCVRDWSGRRRIARVRCRPSRRDRCAPRRSASSRAAAPSGGRAPGGSSRSRPAAPASGAPGAPPSRTCTPPARRPRRDVRAAPRPAGVRTRGTVRPAGGRSSSRAAARCAARASCSRRASSSTFLRRRERDGRLALRELAKVEQALQAEPEMRRGHAAFRTAAESRRATSESEFALGLRERRVLGRRLPEEPEDRLAQLNRGVDRRVASP